MEEKAESKPKPASYANYFPAGTAPAEHMRAYNPCSVGNYVPGTPPTPKAKKTK